MVLIRLNPIIRGWSAYYRHVVSTRVFNALDDHMWKLTYKWAKLTHPHKPKRWIVSRYFGAFNPVQARPVGVRRPRNRRLPAQVRLDEDHPAHAGQGLGVPGRPGPGRLLGGPAPTRADPRWTGPRLRLLLNAARTLPALRGLLLHADHEPQHPDEWEQWITVIRKAIRHQAITVDAGPGHRTDPHRVPTHPHPLPPPPRQAAPAVDQHFCSPT